MPDNVVRLRMTFSRGVFNVPDMVDLLAALDKLYRFTFEEYLLGAGLYQPEDVDAGLQFRLPRPWLRPSYSYGPVEAEFPQPPPLVLEAIYKRSPLIIALQLLVPSGIGSLFVYLLRHPEAVAWYHAAREEYWDARARADRAKFHAAEIRRIGGDVEVKELGEDEPPLPPQRPIKRAARRRSTE
jgi:hypothetical protein